MRELFEVISEYPWTSFFMAMFVWACIGLLKGRERFKIIRYSVVSLIGYVLLKEFNPWESIAIIVTLGCVSYFEGYLDGKNL